MKDYPIDKYNFDIHQHPEYLGTEIVATSTYAGKVVSGKAICHVGDNYNEQMGKELAAARCAQKISKRRLARAEKMYAEAVKSFEAALHHLDDMLIYRIDSQRAYNKAEMKVKSILDKN